jgi:hypothetical protein
MLKKFLITDDAGTDFGILSYEPAGDGVGGGGGSGGSGGGTPAAWHIEINPERAWDDTPLSLAVYIRQGRYSLNGRESLGWVQDRLVPPNRQNINQILDALGIPEYDEFALLQHTKGASPNDNLFLREL